MNNKYLRHRLVVSGLLLLLLMPGAGAAQQANEQDKPLDNSDVFAMQQAGIGESVVVAAVEHAPKERLDGSAEAIGKLKSAGVGERAIAAIVHRVEERQEAAASSEEGGRRKPADIKLFFVDRPAQAFRELGRVSAGKFGTLGRSRKREAINEELKTRAAELGGDAVINITEDFAGVSGVVIAFEKK